MRKYLVLLSAACLLLGACERNDRAHENPQATSQLDNTITQQIQTAISTNPALNVEARNIRVMSNKGEVTIQGTVSSDKQKSAVEALVKAVPGVVSVDNQLEVK